MKKFIALMLAVVMVLSLVACAQAPADNGAANNNVNNDNVADDNAAGNDNGAVDGPADMPEAEVDGPAAMPEDGDVDGPAAMPEEGEVDGPADMPTVDEPTVDAPVEDAPSAPSGDTIGKTLTAYFESLVNGGQTSPEALANAIVTHESILFMGGAMPVEPGWLAGFSADITGFSEGWFFGPMIGTIPFAGYVFTVDGDVDTFVETLKANADLRWNICTAADEINIKAVGNTVFCLLSPYSIEG